MTNYSQAPQIPHNPYASQPGQGGYPPRTNVLAIVSLITAFIAPPAGLVLGIIAYRQIARTGEEGKGLALAGAIVGGVFTGFILLFFIAWLGMFISMFASFMTFSNF
ncbi:MAG: DUF4190 domain-containing protein [Microcella sp.]